MIRAPVMPNGWPTAIAPPETFSLSRSIPTSRWLESTWAAKASLISYRSMSSTPLPARERASLIASAGPWPMTSGDRPVTAVDTIRASGVRPRASAFSALMMTTAAAPSLRGQALPAVIRPSGRPDTVFRPDMPSTVTPARGQSSAETTVPSSRVYGEISRSQKPLAMAFSARFCERAANSSMSAREMFFQTATFSAV